MKRSFIRSNIFNVLFYLLTGLMCLACLPTLFLPRRYFMGVVDAFVHKVYFLERFVLGLRYEVRGAEHLPKNGAYIVAAKHQSAYETMKLHILFKDPAVILKKELLSIPLWGKYLQKSSPIAIDRSNKDAAVSSIQEGAKRVQAENRPIVIFPQGTRVNPDQSTAEKPYKIGIARIQEATGLPIIPMAINAGCFWPRSGWLKSSGVVIFEFLAPIEAGKDKKALMSELEEKIETKSNELIAEARESNTKRRGGGLSNAIFGFMLVLILAGAGYSFLWFKTADVLKKEYMNAVIDTGKSADEITPLYISGFPGKLHAYIEKEIFQDSKSTVTVNNINASGWPIPYLPVDVETGEIEVRYFRWKNPLEIDSVNATFTQRGKKVVVQDSVLKKDAFLASLTGDLELEREPFSNIDMVLNLKNHGALLQILAADGIVDERMAMFMSSGFTSLAGEDGSVNIPITMRSDRLYAGPFPIMRLPVRAPTAETISRTPPVVAP